MIDTSRLVTWNYRLIAAAIVTVLLVTRGSPGQAKPEDVTVRQERFTEAGTQGKRTTLTLSDSPVHAELISDCLNEPCLKPELRFNVWEGDARSYRDSPTLSMERRLTFFRPLMMRLLMIDGQKSTYGLLFYGYTELYDRLPELAAKDAHWDRHTGSPTTPGNVYTYLQDLLYRNSAYRELGEAMATMRYQVEIEGGMENLRVLPASRLSERQRKQLPAGVRAADLLPARVSIDFTLRKND